MNGATKAALIFVFVIVGCKQRTWMGMKPLGSGFYVEMPGAPKEIHDYTQTREGPISFHAWGMTTNHVSFLVAYCDLPNQVTKQSTDGMLNFGRELLVARFSATNLAQTPITFRNHAARHFTISNAIPGYLATGYYLVVTNRIYFVQVAYPPPKVPKAATQRFFNSFKIQ